MPYLIRTTKTNLDFSGSLKDVKVPLLILDQKWHHLFAGSKKPGAVQAAEKQLGEALAYQGRLQQELKEFRKLKSNLMKSIVENMDGTEGNNRQQEKKLQENRRLIDEINEKMEAHEDELLEMPKRLKEINDVLMQETMHYCYGKIRSNALDIDEIGKWIKDIRIELKKQIIRKQHAEILNKEIYSYMHDIFGPKMLDVFDLQYQPEEEAEKETGQEKTAASGTQTE